MSTRRFNIRWAIIGALLVITVTIIAINLAYLTGFFRAFDFLAGAQEFYVRMNVVFDSALLLGIAWLLTRERDLIRANEREIENSEKMKMHLLAFNSIRESIIQADKDGEIIYVNEGARELYGYDIDELNLRRETVDKLDIPIIDPVILGEAHKHGMASGIRRLVTRNDLPITVAYMVQSVLDENHRLASYLAISRDITEIENARAKLEKANRELKNAYAEIIHALVTALEARDEYTKGHSERVAAYALLLASELGFDKEKIEDLKNGCVLHDIGKLTVADYILNKRGKLSSDEYLLVKSHPIKGYDIVKNFAFLARQAPMIRNHHEWYNGSGYPDGLSGHNIPQAARIITIVDSFDAMTSTRPYRKIKTREEAFDELRNGKGIQFDPEFTDIFISIFEKSPAERLDDVQRSIRG